MPDITMPDGTVVNFPDDMPKEQIRGLIASKFPKETALEPTPIPAGALARDTGRVGAAGSGFADFALSGGADELMAGIKSKVSGLPKENLLEAERAQQAFLREKYPKSYLGGQIAGGVTQAGALATAAPAGALTIGANIAKAHPILSSVGLGGLQGYLYGVGTGEGDLQQRATQGIDEGVWGAFGGPLGYVTTKTAGRIASPVFKKTKEVARPLATRAAALFNQTDEVLENISPPKTLGEALPEFDTQVMKGQQVPLTRGQQTGDPRLQSLEAASLRGALGEQAQEQALAAQDVQQQGVRNIIGGLAEGGDEALDEAVSSVQGSFKAIKNQVNKAYEDARVIQNVYINQSPIDEVFKPQVQAILRGGGYDTSVFSDAGKKVVRDIQDSGFYNGQKVTKQNLEKMEFWRRRLTNAAEDARGTSEGRALTAIRDAYDNFMGKLPEHALLSGDDAAIDAINNARYMRRKQGVLFERNKVIKDLVTNKELTNEQLANMILTGVKEGEKINKGAGNVAKTMLRAVDETKRPALKQNLKKGTMARILRKSQGSELLDGQQIIEPSKLRKELDGLLNNKSFLNNVFEEADVSALQALKSDLDKIVGVKKGTVNYSNTAYSLANLFRQVPWVGGNAAKLFEVQGQAKAGKAAEKTFSPVVQAIDELTGPAVFYGASTGGKAAPAIGDLGE